MKIFLFLSFLLFNFGASETKASETYLTPQFRNENSRIPTVYKCAIIGHKMGYSKDSLIVAAAFVEHTGITASQSSDFMSDALTWWKYESTKYDLKGMWNGICEKPFHNIRRTLIEK